MVNEVGMVGGGYVCKVSIKTAKAGYFGRGPRVNGLLRAVHLFSHQSAVAWLLCYM